MAGGGPYPYAVIREPGWPESNNAIGSEGSHLPGIDSGLEYPYISVRDDGSAPNSLAVVTSPTRDEETYSLRIPARDGGDNYTNN